MAFRVINKDGETVFEAIDVCELLGNNISFIGKFLNFDKHRLIGRKKENNPSFNNFNGLCCDAWFVNRLGLCHILVSS